MEGGDHVTASGVSPGVMCNDHEVITVLPVSVGIRAERSGDVWN